MNPRQIDQIRDLFVHVLFEPERASRSFYDRLFVLAPEAGALFTGDMEKQGRVLIQSLSTIVTGLARFDAVAPALRDLAIRHVAYGVERRHYPLVADAMTHMLGDVGGPVFDASGRAAWDVAYNLIADTMIDAAYPTLR